MSEKVESTPAIGISVQCAVSEQRQVVFQCFVPMDADPSVLNAALDKVVLAAERQEARVRLPAARRRLEQLGKVHERAVEDMFRLDAEREAAHSLRASQHRDTGRRGEVKATAQQVAQDQNVAADRAGAETTMKRAMADMDELRAEIAQLESTVGG